MIDQFTGQGQPLRRVAHGNGAAASVKIDARGSSDVAKDAQHLGHLLRADGRGEGKGLLGHHGVHPPLLRRVLSHKYRRGIQGAPKGPHLRTKKGHAGIEINIIDVQPHIPDIDVRIKRRFDAKQARQLFVGRPGIAAQVQIAFSGLRLETRKAGNCRQGPSAGLSLHGFELRETLRDDRVSGIDLECRSQFRSSLVQMTCQGSTFGSLDVSANQLGAQRYTSCDDMGILRGITRGLLVGRQGFLEAPCGFRLVAPLGSLLCALRIGSHHGGLRFPW